MADKIIVMRKCIRCKIKARTPESDNCPQCDEELEAMTAEHFDYYFWGLDASRNDQAMYFIRIYRECGDFDWLIGKNIQVDIDDGETKIHGIVDSAECMQKPPYRSGDVVAVTLR